VRKLYYYKTEPKGMTVLVEESVVTVLVNDEMETYTHLWAAS
jgi:hypothetical protein